MKTLWKKEAKLHEFIETFETKDDILLDQLLVPYDVAGSLAHAQMLEKVGILSKEEVEKLTQGLHEIIVLNEKKQFQLAPGDEDIHTKIELYLTERLGDVGKKIHTGRSRNDQVLTAIRLFTKDNLLQIWSELIDLTESFILFAQTYPDMPMPGYTHMQRAMPYSVGAWALSFVSGFLDSLTLLKTAYTLVDQSPLGSAAAYGMPLKLDKAYAAELLGFARVQVNSLYCQNSRGKLEAVVVSSLISMLSDVNKFASDVLLFTTSEFSLFEVDETVCTGSSVMPQKKNIDIAELIRSKEHLVLGNYMQITSLTSNLISGYNRDTQDMKKPFFESLSIAKDTLHATQILLQHLKPKKDDLTRALSPEVFATHKALELVQQGVPFRTAYHEVSNNIQTLKSLDPQSQIQKAKNLGDTGNLLLPVFKDQLEQEKHSFLKEQEKFQTSMQKLLPNRNEEKI